LTFDTATAARTVEALDTEGGTGAGRPESHAHQFRIVVLDTVTALLGPHLSGISSQGNAPPQLLSHVVLSKSKFSGHSADDDDVRTPQGMRR
jgi:hypothetical protein